MHEFGSLSEFKESVLCGSECQFPQIAGGFLYVLYKHLIIVGGKVVYKVAISDLSLLSSDCYE